MPTQSGRNLIMSVSYNLDKIIDVVLLYKGCLRMDLTIMVMQWKLITKKNQNDILNVANERMLEWYIRN